MSQNQIATLKNYTDRGYTYQEELDSVGLVHMNGRVYDPTMGRFISTDPRIQDWSDSQSINRYSYVDENTLNANDPSGFDTTTAQLGTVYVNGTFVGWAYGVDTLSAAGLGALLSFQSTPDLFGGGSPSGGSGGQQNANQKNAKQKQAEQKPLCTTLMTDASQVGQSLQQISDGLGLIAGQASWLPRLAASGKPLAVDSTMVLL